MFPRNIFKEYCSEIFRTYVHRFFVRIFRHKFIADKAKLRRRAVARQVILTQYALNFAKKTYIVFYEHKFLGRAVLFALPRKAVAFLTLLSVCRSMARGVSSPVGDDKGSSPLTSAAFLKNCCTKKLLFLLLSKIDFRESYLITLEII
jgi:hypothetical protein